MLAFRKIVRAYKMDDPILEKVALRKKCVAKSWETFPPSLSDLKALKKTSLHRVQLKPVREDSIFKSTYCSH